MPAKIWDNIKEFEQRLYEIRMYNKYFDEDINVVMTSGFFTILTAGHIRLIQESEKLGNLLVVIVNDDISLINKKGSVLVPCSQRMEIIAAISGVHHVVKWCGDNVSGALECIKPTIFSKGGDRSCDEQMNVDELAICKKYNIKIIYEVGGKEKINSSSSILAKLAKCGNCL